MTAALPFALTDEIAALVDGALDSGNALLLAAVDRDGKPVLSFRGSTVVFSDTQLSFWARNVEGGTIDAIKANPHVALMYRSQTVPLLQFSGRARLADDAAERDRAFERSHAKEQERDLDRKGQAVIIDLDEVKGVLGFGENGPVFTHLKRG